MSLPHVHTERCPRPCSRTRDLDETTITGAFKIVTGRYGKRPGDRPKWSALRRSILHGLWDVLKIVGVVWAAKKFKIPLEIP